MVGRKPFWVTKSSFYSNFNQQDFLCREVKNVTDAYLAEWFHVNTQGERFFNLPPVSVNSQDTQFISGRHRTAVLIRHLDVLPLSFDFRYLSMENKAWLLSIVAGPIVTGTAIELPDLPVRESLP
jgi:hypothetical protein